METLKLQNITIQNAIFFSKPTLLIMNINSVEIQDSLFQNNIR